MQELHACLRILFELPGITLSHNTLIPAAVFTHQQTQLFGIDKAGCSARLAIGHQRLGHFVAYPLLIGEPMADCINQAGDAAKPVQAAIG